LSEPTSSGAKRAEDGGTVLVTGAAGFLGSRVVRLLGDQGRYRVIGTDVVTSPKSAELANLPRVEFRAFDLRDHTALGDSLAEATHVVHLAAMRGKASQARPREGFDVNVSATYDLFLLAAEHGVRAIVYGSSHLVYGGFADPHRAPYREEDDSARPGLSMYAAAKLACEAFLAPFSDSGGFGYLALRFGGIYGPEAAPGSNSSAMLDVLAALDRDDKPSVSWSKDSLHALIFVDDAARAVVKAVDLPGANTAVNVVGKPVTTREIYSALVRLYGHDPQVLDWREERSRYQLVSNERLHSLLQCPPASTLEDGLQSLIDWHRASR
jgi:UDP-glucose 4-epimerase